MKTVFSLESFRRPCGRLLLLFVLGLGVGAGGPGHAAEKSSGGLEDYLNRLGYKTIAYTSSEKSKPYVEGKLREKKYVFMVDTGWGRTALDERIARDLKTLGELGAELDDGQFGTLTNSALVIMDKLDLGGAQFLNQPARVKKLRADYLKVQYDGVLGYDFLVRNFGLIDCGAHRFYVRQSKPTDEQSKALAESLRRSEFLEVPMDLLAGGTISALVNSQATRLLVDTGSAYTILDESQVSRLQLNMIKQVKTGSLIPGEVSALVVGVGTIGAHRLRVSPVNTLQIASRKWTKVKLGVSNLTAWGELMGADAEAGQLQGVLGLDILANHGALIDLSAGKLWFRPAKQETP